MHHVALGGLSVIPYMTVNFEYLSKVVYLLDSLLYSSRFFK